ncbi:uncharacterized protein EI90DRAFT_3116164 [Cantharellus anzutake]|uniref:uncharacterized protein n=1 Tax=Cantharellus anzutake TaxID=1750568 RepID=UPI001903E0F5|nr:uncharacterized protein EI90DRAFT_3116164 [Cantharellus anzutake]KAF8342238.1 hypothetical protein EI90DRAFT_3116164 [Cantharellus anzutake]
MPLPRVEERDGNFAAVGPLLIGDAPFSSGAFLLDTQGDFGGYSEISLRRDPAYVSRSETMKVPTSSQAPNPPLRPPFHLLYHFWLFDSFQSVDYRSGALGENILSRSHLRIR